MTTTTATTLAAAIEAFGFDVVTDDGVVVVSRRSDVFPATVVARHRGGVWEWTSSDEDGDDHTYVVPDTETTESIAATLAVAVQW